MNNEIQKASDIVNSGGLVIFPTDTAFGIGCRIDKEKSVRKLFKIRKRPETQATPVLVSSIEMAREYVSEISQDVQAQLMEEYWPGALTIVLPAKTEKIPDLVRGGTKTIGVRMPNNQTILEIIQQVCVPILGPSANFHGEKTPYSFEELDQNLVKLVDYVVPGEPSKVHLASTVIDCSVIPWKVLREGPLKLSF